jgi:tetratricopeptide (TPR) repeat protein
MNQFNNGKLLAKSTRLIFALVLLFCGTQHITAEDFANLMSKAADANVQQNYAKALVFYDRAIQIKPNDSFAYLCRGIAHGHARHINQAESDFTQAINLATNNITLSYMFWGRGCFYVEITNIEKAVDDFSRAIQICPSFEAPYLHRACIYNVQQRFDLSIADCNMAIMLNPTNAGAYLCKGQAYCGKKDYPKAIEAYSKALEADTNCSLAYCFRGTAYADNKDYSSSIRDYDKIIQLQPANAMAFASRGLVKSNIGDYSGGIEDCQKAIQLDNHCACAFNNLAWLLAIAPDSKKRDGKTAVEYAKLACELGGWKNAYSLGTLAAASAEIGNFDAAIKWEQKCISIGLPEKEMQLARKVLDLFEHQKPYHADK